MWDGNWWNFWSKKRQQGEKYDCLRSSTVNDDLEMSREISKLRKLTDQRDVELGAWIKRNDTHQHAKLVELI